MVAQVAGLHNFLLMVWSAAMCASVGHAIYKLQAKHGTRSVLCAADDDQAKGLLYCNLYIFYLSKFYELLDTVMQVLKKKKLKDTWRHHTIVLAMTWSWLESVWAPYGILLVFLPSLTVLGLPALSWITIRSRKRGLSTHYRQHTTSSHVGCLSGRVARFRLNVTSLGMLGNTLVVHTFMYYHYYARSQSRTVWFEVHYRSAASAVRNIVCGVGRTQVALV